jgi:uncharacterized protein (DUF2252 family)
MLKGTNRHIVERIQRFNEGCYSDKSLKLKYEKISHDSFSFLRGTCHLYYEDWATDSPLNQAPAAWICGDLHYENFGSYKGDNRLVYFDINDFDEAVLAPCTWDMSRLLTSILVGATASQVSQLDAIALCEATLAAYVTALSKGQICTVERETAAN